MRGNGGIDYSGSRRGDGEEWIDLGCVSELESSTRKQAQCFQRESPSSPSPSGAFRYSVLLETHVGSWTGEQVARAGDP